MIQTQLLRLDPPYQIIFAAGQVGIQLATLIVTEEKTTADGQYAIDTHSHPVVNYGLKQGLERELKYDNMLSPEQSQSFRLQPEGAVWNKVEISDIRVLGLAGAENAPMKQLKFISLVPTDPQYAPSDRVWNEMSILRMYDIFSALAKVGIQCEEFTEYLSLSEDSVPYGNNQTYCVYLELNTLSNTVPMVKVVIRDFTDYGLYPEPEIAFNVRLFDKEENKDTDQCARNIINAVRGLQSKFMRREKLTFAHRTSKANSDNPLEDIVEEVTKRVNEGFRNWR